MAQLLPFHTSARVWTVPPLLNCPTASQADAGGQERPGGGPAPGSGMLTIVHAVPLRVSDSRLPSTLPTATHEAVAGHDTALSVQLVPAAGVVCCSQLAEAGCATTRTADTTSAAAIAIRLIAVFTPRSYRWSGGCEASAMLMVRKGSPARTPAARRA